MKRNAMVKTLSLFLALLMLCTALASCVSSGTGDDSTTGDGSTTPDTTPVPEETTPITGQEEFLDLVVNGETSFTLIKPIAASDEQLELINYFQEKFEKKTGVTLPLTYEKRSDADNDNYEILIGETMNPASIEKNAEMREKDFFYGIIGNKLIFVGGNTTSLKSAIQYFERKFLDAAVKKDKNNITFDLSDNYSERVLYYLEDFKIGSEDASKFTVVYSNNDLVAAKVFAKKLANLITDRYGFKISSTDDSEKASPYEIVVGSTNRGNVTPAKNCGSITYKDGKMYISCDISAGYDYLYSYMDKEFLYGDRKLKFDQTKNLNVELSTLFTGGTENILERHGSIRILLNNIWSGADNAILRANQLKEVYKDYAPDVIGLQEFSGSVKTQLKNNILSLGYKEIPYHEKNYNYAVQTPIFYNPKTLKVIDSGFWKYNDEAGDKSKSVAWCLFEQISTGKRIIVGSTHFMWTSPALGSDLANLARTVDATEMCELLIKLSKKYNAPVIVGGDFNCNINSQPAGIIKQNGFVDIENLATKTELGGTHHSYPSFADGICTSYSSAGGTYETAIDHIFAYNQSMMDIGLYDVVEDFLALASSDHCPMITDVTLK